MAQTLAKAAGGELCDLIPELAGAVPPSAAPQNAEGARYRVLRGIGGRARRRARQTATGCSWSSTTRTGATRGRSRPCARCWTRRSAQRLSLLVTARDRELGRRHPVTQALNELRRTRELTELKLDGLDAGGISALLAARLGRTVAPRDRGSAGGAYGREPVLHRRARARSGGSRTRCATTRRWTVLRSPRRSPASWRNASSACIPTPRRCSWPPRRSAPGPSVALAGAAAGLDGAELTSAVSEAVAQRLIDEEPALEPTVVFPHALVREALLGLRTDAERARLHHAIAEQLAERPATEPGELARHRELAAPVTGPGPAVAAHRLAADAAARAGAHDEAADHLDAALRLAGPHDPERAPTLVALGDQRLLAADLRRGRVAYRAAAAVARATGDVMTLARAALGDAGGVIGFVVEMPQEDPDGPRAASRGTRRARRSRPGPGPRALSLRRAWALDVHRRRAASCWRWRRRPAARLARGTEEAQYLAKAVECVSLAVRSEAPLVNPGRAWDIARTGSRARRAQRPRRPAAAGAADGLVRGLRPGGPGRVDALLARMDDVVARLDAPRYQSEVDFLRGWPAHGSRRVGRGRALFRRAGGALRDVRSELQVGAETGHHLHRLDADRGGGAHARGAQRGRGGHRDRRLLRPPASGCKRSAAITGGARAELRALAGRRLRLAPAPRRPSGAQLVLCAWAAEVCSDHDAGARCGRRSNACGERSSASTHS